MLSHVRAFATSSRPVRATRFVDAFLRDTREPIWRVVSALNTPRSRDLPAALTRHGVSVEQLRLWRPMAYESNLDAAVDLVHHKRLSVHHMPSWLVLYLLAFKVRTIDNAFPTALDLAYAHLAVAPTPVHGPLLVLTLLALARFTLLLPMRRVVDSFLLTNLHHPQLCFNLLLQAIACTPTRSIDAANAVVAILKRMDARQLKLTHPTYDALLNDRFVTLQLTQYLRERMTREGTVPTAEHLEAYLRVFAKHGAIHTAADYHHAIHARHPQPVPADSAADPLHRANTLFLTAQNDRASAFNFLRTLLDPSSPPVPSSPPPPPKPKPIPDIYTYTAALSLAARDHSLPAPALLALFKRAQRLASPTAPTTATHTVLLRGLLARKSPLALDAWNAFYRSGLRIDREALAAGMQVLTRAGAPHRAWALLEEVAGPAPALPAPSRTRAKRPHRNPLPLPLTAVTVNDWLVSLNRIGRPDVVFALWDGMRDLYGVHPDARTLSLVLQAARLAGRLDGESFGGAVVRLGLEFGFHRREREPATDADPDTSRTAVPDESASTDATTTTTTARAFHATHIASLLGPAHLPSPHAYKPALWHTTLPSTHALLAFQQALFGAARTPSRLRDVAAPAQALERWAPSSARAAPEGEGLGLVVGLPRWRGGRAGSGWVWPGWEVLLRRRRQKRRKSGDDTAASFHTDEPEPASPADFWTRWESRHPGVAPTNENCFHYILLLGLTGRAREVALVLAWMREVGIWPGRPTLGAALVLWREVCAPRGVLVERWTGRGDGGGDGDGREGRDVREGEYGKLVAWLAEWVGVGRVPGARALAVWTRNLARLREGGRGLREVEEVIEEAEKEAEAEVEEGEQGVENEREEEEEGGHGIRMDDKADRW